MSRIVRDIGGTLALARNWTLSNIREGLGAFGFHPKYWTKKQKDFTTNWFRKALLRVFTNLFIAANVITYMVSKHSYGKGRSTLGNSGKLENKLYPLMWVDKKTGKEFYATGWYGSGGDIVHWMTRPITTAEHKLHIPVKEISEQMANRDFFTGEKIWLASDNMMEGIKHRLGHMAESFFTPAGIQLQIGKYPIPLGPKVLRGFGIMLSSAMRDQDLMTKMYNFKEKKRYKVKDIDRGLYKLLAEGDRAAFMKKVREERRYQTRGGASNMIRKFDNPLKSYYGNLNHQDRRDFLETLSPSEKERLGEAIRRRRQ